MIPTPETESNSNTTVSNGSGSNISVAEETPLDKDIAARIMKSTRIHSANKGPSGQFYKTIHELLDIQEQTITPTTIKHATQLLSAIFSRQPYSDMFSHIINGKLWQKKFKTANDIRSLIDQVRSYILTNADFIGKRGFGSSSPRRLTRRRNKISARKTRKHSK
jgi:hypothetical protein